MNLLNNSQNFPLVFLSDLRLIDQKTLNPNDQRLEQRRIAKIKRYRNPEDKIRSIIAGLLLFHALGDQVHQIVQNDYGKPYLNDGPFFNLSHSGNIVMLAVDSNHSVGCDVQWHDEIQSDVIAKHLFHPQEYDFYRQCAFEQKRRIFYQFWTLKESYMKMIGKGFGISSTSFQLEINLEINAEILLKTSPETQPADFPRPFFRLFDGKAEYSAAVCSDSPLNDLTVVPVNDFNIE